MFEVDPSKSYKELIAQINKDELPKEVQVNLDKVAVSEGIDSVTGSDQEVKNLFAAIEKHYPKALAVSDAPPATATKESDSAAVGALEAELLLEEDEVKIAEINAAIDAFKEAIDLDLY